MESASPASLPMVIRTFCPDIIVESFPQKDLYGRLKKAGNAGIDEAEEAAVAVADDVEAAIVVRYMYG